MAKSLKIRKECQVVPFLQLRLLKKQIYFIELEEPYARRGSWQMIRNGEMALSDIKRIVRRYWWIPVILTVLLGASGYAASILLPKKYTSSSLVLVEQPAVPKDMIKPVVSDQLDDQIVAMKAQILSRPKLEMVINKYNLYPQQRSAAHMEDLADKLKSAVNVDLIQPSGGANNQDAPGFVVNVTFENPMMAQQICQEFTSMFMEQNATNRVNKSNKTTQILTERLNEAKAKLDEQDRKLAEFKGKNLVALPEQEQMNLTLLSGMNTQLDSTAQALTRTQQDKTLNETLLAQQETNWKASQVGQQNPESQEQELAALQEQLSVLLTRYTPEHPDVVKVKSQIEGLKRRMAETPVPKNTPSATQTSLREPPSIQQLRTKIKQDEFTIADLTKREGQLQDQIHTVQSRLQASPVVEQQLKELTRNYQTASDIYNDLLKNREKSEMATGIENQQEGESFKVLDSPSLPSTPSFPKKSMFVGGGIAGGLALACAILYLLAINDKAMYTERDVELSLKLPVLTTVPSFEGRAYANGWKSKDVAKYDEAVTSKV